MFENLHPMQIWALKLNSDEMMKRKDEMKGEERAKVTEVFTESGYTFLII